MTFSPFNSFAHLFVDFTITMTLQRGVNPALGVFLKLVIFLHLVCYDSSQKKVLIQQFIIIMGSCLFKEVEYSFCTSQDSSPKQGYNSFLYFLPGLESQPQGACIQEFCCNYVETCLFEVACPPGSQCRSSFLPPLSSHFVGVYEKKLEQPKSFKLLCLLFLNIVELFFVVCCKKTGQKAF